MRLAGAVVAGLLLAAGGAGGAGKQVIRYHGIYCDTGTSYKGTPSVVCGPRDRTGYDVLMSKTWFVVRHNGVFTMVRRNR